MPHQSGFRTGGNLARDRVVASSRRVSTGGATSLRAIAASLNQQGIPTARGSGQWSAVQVARVLERIG